MGAAWGHARVYQLQDTMVQRGMQPVAVADIQTAQKKLAIIRYSTSCLYPSLFLPTVQNAEKRLCLLLPLSQAAAPPLQAVQPLPSRAMLAVQGGGGAGLLHTNGAGG